MRRAFFERECAIGQAQVLIEAESDGTDDIAFYHTRYFRSSELSGICDRHLLLVNTGPPVPVLCRIGKLELDHEAQTGNITLIPAGTAWSGRRATAGEIIVVALPTDRLAAAAAQALRPAWTVRPSLYGQDADLRSIIAEMAQHTRSRGADPREWQNLADELIDQLVDRYQAGQPGGRRGRLPRETVARINDFLETRLEGKLAVDEIADVANQNPWHFSRVFRRTIGMSPHQYVMRLRLRRARGLIERGMPLAEVAVASGFVDQSHLTNWVRRIYGTTPRRFHARG